MVSARWGEADEVGRAGALSADARSRPIDPRLHLFAALALVALSACSSTVVPVDVATTEATLSTDATDATVATCPDANAACSLVVGHWCADLGGGLLGGCVSTFSADGTLSVACPDAAVDNSNTWALCGAALLETNPDFDACSPVFATLTFAPDCQSVTFAYSPCIDGPGLSGSFVHCQ